MIKGRDPIVIEAGGTGAKYRHFVPWRTERTSVSHQLSSHITARVLRTTALVLVYRNHVGEIEHVNLLELRSRTIFRSHNIKGGVNKRYYGRVTLTDTRGLDNDKIESSGLARCDDVGQRGRGLPT